MDISSLEAFSSSKEFIDPNDGISMQRVSEVSHDLSTLMQQVAHVKTKIRFIDTQSEELLVTLNKQLHLCATNLDVIRKKQELKNKYEDLAELQLERSKLQEELSQASVLYCTAKTKLDLINEHAFKPNTEVTSNDGKDTGGEI